MQLSVFYIPLSDAQRATDELNAFLRGHKVLATERHFCPDRGGYWTVAVEWVESGHAGNANASRRSRSDDVSDTLSGAHRERFIHYRRVRLKAAKFKGLPAFGIFTDRELVALSGLEHLDAESAKSLKKVSKARLRENIHFLTDDPWPGDSAQDVEQAAVTETQEPHTHEALGLFDGAGG